MDHSELPYRAVSPPPRVRLSESIAAQVEELIVNGRLTPGHALPPERVLAQRFGVSRPSLREALLRLEARGLLKVQRGGRFAVTDVTAPTMTDPLVHLLKRHPSAEQDVLEMRHGLEMVAAYFAAQRVTKDDRLHLRRAYDNMIKTRTKRDSLADAEADADFHLAVAEASHNVALVHVMRGIYNLLRMCMHHAWDVMYREPGSVRLLHEQHKAMLDAILAGNADRAREAAHLHLSFVRETLQQRDSGRHVRRGKPPAPQRPAKRTK
jgi:GntR family transcriptional repressor for pyruvate dehydrogenase complex